MPLTNIRKLLILRSAEYEIGPFPASEYPFSLLEEQTHLVAGPAIGRERGVVSTCSNERRCSCLCGRASEQAAISANIGSYPFEPKRNKQPALSEWPTIRPKLRSTLNRTRLWGPFLDGQPVQREADLKSRRSCHGDSTDRVTGTFTC
jgi:hypothetical protein